MPLISVIVPVYKVEPYLHRCVDSILAQTFINFEIILVDDGSPDNSGAICDEYAKNDFRIHVIHQENGGLSAARNAGIEWAFSNSNSQWLSFIDSDDWVHSRYLELLYTAVEKYDAEISQCGLYRTEKLIDDQLVEGKMYCVSPEEQYSKRFTAYACGKLYKKTCFSTIRYPQGILFEDVTIWYKILFTLDKIAIVDEPLYYYFQREEGITNSTWIPAKLSQIEAWENQLSFAVEHGSKPVLYTVLKRFCWVYKHQCEEINSSNLISEKDRRKYHASLIRRFRIVLFKYRKELKEIGIFSPYLDFAFPRSSWLYWTIRGVYGKVKKMLT